MTGLPLIAQARADLELVGWRLNVLLTLAHELLDVHEYRQSRRRTRDADPPRIPRPSRRRRRPGVSPVLDPGRSVG
jgi:hypothetical protein